MLLFQPQPATPVINALLLTKKQLAEILVKEIPTSRATAYRLISGERKFMNEYEADYVSKLVERQIEKLQHI